MQFPMEPGPGVTPMPLCGYRRDAKQRRRFFMAETSKESELNDLCHGGILAGQFLQGFVECDHVVLRNITHDLDVLQAFLRQVASSLDPPLLAGLVDEDSSHRFGCGEKEMPPALPWPGLVSIHKPQIGLVNEGCGLESVTGRLLAIFWAASLCSSS